MLKEIEKNIRDYDEQLYVHCMNTGNIASYIAKEIAPCKSDMLRNAGYIHDIGKIFISKEILMKNGPLTADERKVVDKHSQLGYSYLKEKGIDDELCNLVLMHHGMHREGHDPGEIFLAEILRAADIFDAITSVRSYHQALSMTDACVLMQSLPSPLPDIVMEKVRRYAHDHGE